MKKLILITLSTFSLAQAESEYRSSLELIKVFINPAQKADKDFEYWIEQLRYHVTHKEGFSVFESNLRECLHRGASQNAFHVFSSHKNLFHPSLQVELFKLGLPKVKAAFQERLAQHIRINEAKRTPSTPVLFQLWKSLKDAHPVVEPQVLHEEQHQKYLLIHAWLQQIAHFPLTDQPSAEEEATILASCETV